MVQHCFVMVGCTKLSYSIIFVELRHKSLQLSYVMHKGIDLHDQLSGGVGQAPSARDKINIP